MLLPAGDDLFRLHRLGLVPPGRALVAEDCCHLLVGELVGERRHRGGPSPSPSARTIAERPPPADGPVRAFSGSSMVCHGRAIEWDAHPRRSAVAIVDTEY